MIDTSGQVVFGDVGTRQVGELVFVVGEVRQWLVEHEETVMASKTAPLVMSMRKQA